MSYLDEFTKSNLKIGQQLIGGSLGAVEKPVKAASILDNAKTVLGPGGQDDDNIEKVKAASEAVHQTLGGYALKDSALVAQDMAGNITAAGGSGPQNVTDVIKARNKGGLTAVSDDTKDAVTLTDNKITRGAVNLAKKGVKTVAKKSFDAIKATPEFKPTVEAIEGIGRSIDKAVPIAKKTGGAVSKALKSPLAKGVGQAANVVTGAMTAVEGAREIAGVSKSSADTAGSAMKVAGGTLGAAAGVATGVAALTGVAAANFWNPVGWVAGALAIGGTLVKMRDKFNI